MRDELLGVVKLELEDVVFVELKEVLEVVGRGFTVGGGGFLGGVLEFIFEGEGLPCVRDELLGVVKLELEDVVFLELEEVLEFVKRRFPVGIGGFLGGVLELVFLKLSCSLPAVDVLTEEDDWLGSILILSVKTLATARTKLGLLQLHNCLPSLVLSS